MSRATGSGAAVGDETRPRRRQRPALRRAQIIDAAAQLLLHGGAGHVGLRDIAAAADVSIGTVTYHFASVDEILELAFAQEVSGYYEDLHQRIEAEHDPKSALDLFIASCFTEHTARHWRVWFEHHHRGDYVKNLDSQRERYARWADMVRGLVQRGVEAGEFDCPDVEEAVTILVALVDGLALRHIRGAPALSLDTARAYFRRAAERTLRL